MAGSKDPVYEQLEFIFNLPTYSYSSNSHSKIRLLLNKLKTTAKRINPYYLIIFILLAYIVLSL